MALKPDFGGMADGLSIQQGVLMGRRSDIEAEARKRDDDVVTSISVGAATTYIASGEIDVRRLHLCRNPRRTTRPVYSRCTRVESDVYDSYVPRGERRMRRYDKIARRTRVRFTAWIWR